MTLLSFDLSALPTIWIPSPVFRNENTPAVAPPEIGDVRSLKGLVPEARILVPAPELHDQVVHLLLEPLVPTRGLRGLDQVRIVVDGRGHSAEVVGVVHEDR